MTISSNDAAWLQTGESRTSAHGPVRITVIRTTLWLDAGPCSPLRASSAASSSSDTSKKEPLRNASTAKQVIGAVRRVQYAMVRKVLGTYKRPEMSSADQHADCRRRVAEC